MQRQHRSLTVRDDQSEVEIVDPIGGPVEILVTHRLNWQLNKYATRTWDEAIECVRGIVGKDRFAAMKTMLRYESWGNGTVRHHAALSTVVSWQVGEVNYSDPTFSWVVATEPPSPKVEILGVAASWEEAIQNGRDVIPYALACASKLGAER